MKTEVGQNDFVTFYMLPQTNIIEAAWKESTQKMKDDDFKSSIKLLWKLIAENKPIGLLADTRLFFYAIPPQVQEWYGANITEGLGSTTKKVAMLLSSEFFSQISIEQTIQEDNRTGFSTQYFDDAEKAIEWLKS